MVGIVSYGAYVPWYRLSRKTIFSAMGWFNPVALPGEKTVANYDEDSVTMAVAAGVDCLRGFKRESIDGLYFASTTSPYRERQNASIIASAFDLRPDIRTADFTNSVRCGTSALFSACETIKGEGAQKILVCASDCRLGKSGSIQEQIFGDGGAALLVGKEGVIAALEGFHSLSYDFIDHRRVGQDIFDRSWEERWIRDVGYTGFITEAITGLLKKYGLYVNDFAKIVYTCPYDREHAVIAKKLGIEPGKLQYNMMADIGDTGAAYSLMMLVKALEKAKPGDKILVAGYGNGCDALYLQVTEEIESLKGSRGVTRSLENKKELTSYEKYITFRNFLPLEVGIRGEEVAFTNLSTLWRERKSVLALCGVKCKQCGTPQYPYQRVCVNPECGAIDQMEEYRFSDQKGYLFSYTADNLAFSIVPPALYGIVNFEGGGRYMFDLTDCELPSLRLGMPVEMSFRRKYTNEARGIYGYFWKAVPIKEEG